MKLPKQLANMPPRVLLCCYRNRDNIEKITWITMKIPLVKRELPRLINALSSSIQDIMLKGPNKLRPKL